MDTTTYTPRHAIREAAAMPVEVDPPPSFIAHFNEVRTTHERAQWARANRRQSMLPDVDDHYEWFKERFEASRDPLLNYILWTLNVGAVRTEGWVE